MSHTRRRVLRTARPTAGSARQHRAVEPYSARLKAKQAALARWMAKLKRAFHTVERLQQQIARLERAVGHGGRR
jgi:hypothetical protein